MKLTNYIIVCLLALAACTHAKNDPRQDKVIVAYVTSWSDKMPDPNYITHINYAFGHVTDNFDGVRINNEERLKQIVALKKDYPHLRVLLSVGGWGSGRFSEMAADEALRASFATDCQRIVKEFSLDGIDIDWEYPTADMAGISASPDDTKNYTLLMRDIRNAIGKDKLLTQATAASGEYMDHKALDEYLDFTNIMTYDMGNPPIHHSALYRSEMVDRNCGDEAVKKHLAAGVPKHKLVMGMPFYGRAVKEFQRPKDLTKAHEMEGYTSHWDEVAMVPYLTDNTTGAVVFCYENLESLAIKCQYVMDNELRGAMYWSADGDNEAGDLRKTVYNGIMK